MGIVNLTPDSFSGDGYGSTQLALQHAEEQIAAGADLLDLGAESSRPGAISVSQEQELDRLLPVLEGLCSCGVPLSIDTCKPGVMRAALQVGADMVNDISALAGDGALEVLVDSQCAVCLMHMQGSPSNMQNNPLYNDVVQEVGDFLYSRKAACVTAGIAEERILLDYGFGFGKKLEHNLALFRSLPQLAAVAPVLVGFSRKSMIGQITGKEVTQRMSGSVAAALLAAQSGASVLRVHDVAATRDALRVWQALSYK